MKNINTWAFALLTLISLSSCEEVIEIDLNESNPQWVIQGQVDSETRGAFVEIKQTGSYFENEEPIAGTDALVKIEDNIGNSYVLSETNPGRYEVEDLAWKVGTAYSLEVKIEEENIRGITESVQAVPIDSLSASFEPGIFGMQGGYLVNVHFQDPADSKTYLRFLLTVNGEKTEDFLLYDDNFSDGQAVSFPFFAQRFEEGDEIEVEIWAIDEASYRYFTSLSEIIGQGMGPASAAPANPSNNLSGSSLGYFSALSISHASLTIE